MRYTTLSLCNELTWCIFSNDDFSDKSLHVFSQALQLQLYNISPSALVKAFDRCIEVSSSIGDSPQLHQHANLFEKLTISSEDKKSHLVRDLWRLSARVIQDIEANSGTLLHGALIEKNWHGYILIGRSGIGKSTACSRLPSHWSVLSDDKTMVIKRQDGTIWAHPWPTWMHLIMAGTIQRWDVEKAVKIKGIYFLEQADCDAVRPIGKGEAAGLLYDSAEQGAFVPWQEPSRKQSHQRFNTACDLARSVPSYRLDISLDGEFWKLLE